jgi:hypothetical protein
MTVMAWRGAARIPVTPGTRTMEIEPLFGWVAYVRISRNVTGDFAAS